MLTVFVLHLMALSVSCVPIVLQFIVRMFSISISGMPNNACPFPGTTKKLKTFLCYYVLFLLCICLIVYCCLVICFTWIFVFLVATNYSVVALENNFLYICNSIIFPSLPVSTLHVTVIMTLIMFLDLLLFSEYLPLNKWMYMSWDR